MPDDLMNNPEHWRERAEETRTKADHVWYDDKQKQKLLRVADEYDRLAERAAQWQTLAEIPRR